MKRSRALTLYFGVLFVAIGLCAVLPVLQYVLSAVLATLIAAAALRLLCCDTADADDADAPPLAPAAATPIESPLLVGDEGGEPRAPATTTPEHVLKPRLFYLDNLKSFLTAVVVAHHVGCIFIGGGWMYQVAVYRTSLQPLCAALLGLDQAYFMALFFFVSGYFTPSSYDRKGRRAFLRDKAKRLGLPFLAYLFVFGPLLDLFISEAMTSAEHVYRYAPDPGPPWFLAWLCLFNACYAFCGADDERAPTLAPPTLARLAWIGAALGAVSAPLIAVLGGGFVMMPITFGSLPFDVLFFAGGVLAKRNDWLHNAVPELKDTGARGVAVAVTVVISLATLASTFALYFTHTAAFGQASNGGDDDHSDDDHDDGGDDGGDAAAGSVWTLASFLAVCVVLGVFCMTCSVAQLALFHDRLNYRSDRTAFFSDAAYAVYLIHPWVITPIAWGYVLLYERFTHDHVFFREHATTSTSRWKGGATSPYIWLGWALVNVLSQLVVWPLASQFRKLPVLRGIL